MQFLRPVAQVGTNGLWKDQAGASIAMHLAIDEVVRDTSDYAQAFGSGIGGDTLEYYMDIQLGSSQPPVTNTGLMIKFWGHIFGSNGLKSIQLIRVSTTVVVHEEFNSLSTTPTLYTITLTAGEAAQLSGGYDIGGGLSDFSLKFIRIGDESSSNGVRIEQAYMEIPDPGFEHLDISTGYGLKVAAISSGNYLETPSGSGIKRVSGGEGTTALIISSGIGVKIHG